MNQASVGNIFQELLHLTGKRVEVSRNSTGQRLTGKITNTMFDSFVLETDKEKYVIAFEDIFYLNPL